MTSSTTTLTHLCSYIPYVGGSAQAALPAPPAPEVQERVDVLLGELANKPGLELLLCHFFNNIELLRKMKAALEKYARTHTIVSVFDIPALNSPFEALLHSVLDMALLAPSENPLCRNLSQEMRQAILNSLAALFHQKNEAALREIATHFGNSTVNQVAIYKQDMFSSLEKFLSYRHTAGGHALEDASHEDVLASIIWEDFCGNDGDLSIVSCLTLRAMQEDRLMTVNHEQRDEFQQNAIAARRAHHKSCDFAGNDYFARLAVNVARVKKSSFGEALKGIQNDATFDLAAAIPLIGQLKKDFHFTLGDATTKKPEPIDAKKKEEVRNYLGRTKLGRVIYRHLGIALF